MLHTRIRQARENMGYTREKFAENWMSAFLIWRSANQSDSIPPAAHLVGKSYVINIEAEISAFEQVE